MLQCRCQHMFCMALGYSKMDYIKTQKNSCFCIEFSYLSDSIIRCQFV